MGPTATRIGRMASGESDTTERTAIAERGGADGKEGEQVEAGLVVGGETAATAASGVGAGAAVGGAGVGGHWTSSQFNRMHSLDE